MRVEITEKSNEVRVTVVTKQEPERNRARAREQDHYVGPYGYGGDPR